ncbi:MAG: aldo/keto reductase [Spirochaetaceae bacterium]|nr:MAG: aldo/keto reductase [Spirochaetaceae bacterium]
MPTRMLGRTGERIGIFSLGGEATVEQRHNRERAIAIIDRAIDLGVNYIDTSPRYGAGSSERNIGEVMRRRRAEVFLATKTHDRSYDGTLRLFEQSLSRLQTDRVELYQIHNVRTRGDVDAALARNGAVRAARRLQDEGAVRFVGISGHRDPTVLLDAINRYEFDSVLMSLNAADVHYQPFQTELLKAATEKQMGVIAMKVTAVGRIFREGGLTSMEHALSYVLSFPVTTAIVGISSINELEENVRIAKAFSPLSASQLEEIESLTASYADAGNFFKHHW